jgi:ribosomal protein L40E
MVEFIEFTRNYRDRSTQRGFQWEFYCERCHNGYRSKFRPSATGLMKDALDVAGSLLGGRLGRARHVGHRVHSVAWERAHDEAFHKASAEVRAYFVQCPRCNEWVCRERCWNESRGLCFDCAPDVAVQAASAQAASAAAQATTQVRKRAYDVEDYVAGDALQAACPHCGAAVKPGAKFCAACGQSLTQGHFCMQCGARIEGKAKFCPECGTKLRA